MGKGFLNSVINKLPFEIHLPGYQFCGPGTKLKERLKAGQQGINGLDRACRMHDIAYNEHPKITDRKIADMILSEQAMTRANAHDASKEEKLAALTVAGLMKVKSALGAGMRTKNKKIKKTKVKKRNSTNTNRKLFRNVVNSAKAALTKQNPKTMSNAVRVAIQGAKSSMVNNNNNESSSKCDHIQRVIPVPKIGGVLPLIPIFAGLSALGALTGGSAAVANAVITANNAKQQLKESEQHNRMMEAIALGKNKRGDGIFLKPYRNGLGLYTHTNKKSFTKNS